MQIKEHTQLLEVECYQNLNPSYLSIEQKQIIEKKNKEIVTQHLPEKKNKILILL
jgi:hypothetical protein